MTPSAKRNASKYAKACDAIIERDNRIGELSVEIEALKTRCDALQKLNEHGTAVVEACGYHYKELPELLQSKFDLWVKIFKEAAEKEEKIRAKKNVGSPNGK